MHCCICHCCSIIKNEEITPTAWLCTQHINNCVLLCLRVFKVNYKDSRTIINVVVLASLFLALNTLLQDSAY